MKRITKLVLAGALALPAFSAYSGDTISYDYLNLSIGSTTLDTPDIDGDGAMLSFSKALAPNWHMFADYNWVNYGSSLEHKTMDLGFGYNHQIEEGVDFSGRLGWVDTKFEEVGIDDSGWIVQLLMRGRPTAKFHMDLGAEYVDLGGDSDAEAAFVWSGRYFLADKFAAGLSVHIGDIRSYGVDLRYEFK